MRKTLGSCTDHIKRDGDLLKHTHANNVKVHFEGYTQTQLFSLSSARSYDRAKSWSEFRFSLCFKKRGIIIYETIT